MMQVWRELAGWWRNLDARWGESAAEAETADRGAGDAERDVFDPPVRPKMRRAYERGWWHIQGQW